MWSNANGQDDLVWYDGGLTGSTWSAGEAVEPQDPGRLLHPRVYADGKLVAHTTANVHGMPPQQSVQAIVTDDLTGCGCVCTALPDTATCAFAVEQRRRSG